MRYSCNKGHIGLTYNSEPCPLCASHKRMDELKAEVAELKQELKDASFESHVKANATIERLRALLREISVCFADQWNWDDLGHDQQDAITAINAELGEENDGNA